MPPEVMAVAFPPPGPAPCARPVRFLRTRTVDVVLAVDEPIPTSGPIITAVLLGHTLKGPRLISRDPLGPSSEVGDPAKATAVTLGSRSGVVFERTTGSGEGAVAELRPYAFGPTGAVLLKASSPIVLSGTTKSTKGQVKVTSEWRIDAVKWVVLQVDWKVEAPGEKSTAGASWRVQDDRLDLITGSIPEEVSKLQVR